jgi:hypothetical protein
MEQNLNNEHNMHYEHNEHNEHNIRYFGSLTIHEIRRGWVAISVETTPQMRIETGKKKLYYVDNFDELLSIFAFPKKIRTHVWGFGKLSWP